MLVMLLHICITPEPNKLIVSCELMYDPNGRFIVDQISLLTKRFIRFSVHKI